MKISVAERCVSLHTDNKSRGSGTVMSSLISLPGPQPGIPLGPVAPAGTEGEKPSDRDIIVFYSINTATTSGVVLLGLIDAQALIVVFFLLWLQELPVLSWVIRWTR